METCADYWNHRHYKHRSKPNVVTIPGHVGDDVPTGTLKSILKAAALESKQCVPDLPGCISTRATLEETERNIQEAVRGHLAVLREFGEQVPPPTSVAREIEVPG